MNEVTQIFGKMDISIWDVLDAAGTKWNFLPFQPGLVGGHCIGVDPYYLSHRAQELGHDPQVILAGRATNDAMGSWIANQIHERRGGKPGTVLMMGLTFKENVPDLRNSKVVDVINALIALGHQVVVHDPLADGAEAQHEYGLAIDAVALERRYDAVVGAVSHNDYRELSAEQLDGLIAEGGLLADLKKMWPGTLLADGKSYWSL
jgi:UDP-N-acetyl-D-galactosamine dehydrogenase